MPAKIVGPWSRNETKANQKKYGVTSDPAGVWTITFRKSGELYVYRPGMPSCPSCSPLASISFSVAGARLTIGPVVECISGGVYGWKVSGRALTLRLIADKTCGTREALFTGVWKRK